MHSAMKLSLPFLWWSFVTLLTCASALPARSQTTPFAISQEGSNHTS